MTSAAAAAVYLGPIEISLERPAHSTDKLVSRRIRKDAHLAWSSGKHSCVVATRNAASAERAMRRPTLSTVSSSLTSAISHP